MNLGHSQTPDPDSEEEDGIWLFISAYDDNDNPLEDAKF
jgi:hypothetical protein